MNLFRGYTDGLASSYGIATYQSRTFSRPSAPKPACRPFVKALKAVAHIFSRRGGSPAPSELSSKIFAVFSLFSRSEAPQMS